MRVFIGANNNNQMLNARDWLLKNEFQPWLDDLAEWVVKKEPVWGEGFLFLEVVLPTGVGRGSRNQLDLLVSFSDRAALCELKQHWVEKLIRLGECVDQINGQANWMRRLLIAEGYEEQKSKKKSFWQFLFLPRLRLHDVQTVADKLVDQHSAQHIWPCGGDPELRKESCRGQYAYLTEALEASLSRCGTLLPVGKPTLQQFLCQQMTIGSANLQEFESLHLAKTFLKATSNRRALRYDPWYVEGLRDENQRNVMNALVKAGIVELVGPPGVGKSTLVKEVLDEVEREGREGHEIDLRKCKSVQEICGRIHEVIHGDKDEGLGEETYVQKLCEEPCVIWIRTYDAVSTKSVDEFVKIVCRLYGKKSPGQAYWLIESRQPLNALAPHRQKIGTLDNLSLSRILELVPAGGAYTDPEHVVDLASGNAGRAVRLWQSELSGVEVVEDEFAWFAGQLAEAEKRLLPVLCLVARKFPLGVGSKTMYQAAGLAFPGRLASDIQQSVDSVLRKLEQCQLADVTRLNGSTFNGLLDEVLPVGLSFTIINQISTGVVDYVLNKVDAEKHQQWQDELDLLLLSDASSMNLAYVTCELNLGNLEPFFRSSFRYTLLGSVIEWVDRNEWKVRDGRQAYLLRALRLLAKLDRHAPRDIDKELGIPSSADSTQQFAYDFVRSRALTVQTPAPDDTTIKLWLARARECKDSYLQATIYISVTTAIQNKEQGEDAWRILLEAAGRHELGSNEHGLVTMRKLQFLNATKARKQAMTDSVAYPIIQKLSRELIAEGLRVENLQLVCDGLFYFVRSQEWRDARNPTSCRDVLGYLAALRFIEEVPRTRGRQRLKILLTQGSVFKHFCRQDNLEWGVFRQHFENGLAAYSRAFRSALVQRHFLDLFDSLSYMATLCLTALRFADKQDSWATIIEKTGVVIDYIRQAVGQQDVAFGKRLQREEATYKVIQRHYTVLLYIAALAESTLSETCKNELIARFPEYVKAIVADAVFSGSKNEVKNALQGLYRAIHFGVSFRAERNSQLLALLKIHLLDLLDGTKRIREKNKPLPVWEKLSRLVPSTSRPAGAVGPP